MKKTDTETTSFIIYQKDPDLLWKLPENFQEKLKKFFEFGEYFSLLVEVDEEGNVVGGKFREK